VVGTAEQTVSFDLGTDVIDGFSLLCAAQVALTVLSIEVTVWKTCLKQTCPRRNETLPNSGITIGCK